ncbi:MAG: ribonuclease P protein component [Endomicrobium sp.]|jgi:ribonuclease P protein component|nr:ribonuclease P protein component [Endomicrobium sp.]
MKNFSFSYSERLHSQKDFNKVFKNGIKLENKAVKILAYKKSGVYIKRLGLITSRKVGIAVERNRLKRRLREIFRTNKHLLAPGLDIIFISKSYGASLDYNSLKKNVLDLLKGVSKNL